MSSNLYSTSELWLGPGTDLILQAPGVDGRFKSSIVGVEGGEYLIVRTPKEPNITRKLFVGNQVTVIALCQGTVFGFRSSILNSISNPAQLIFLSYPTRFERQELRKCERVECHIPAIASALSDQRKQNVIIVDISAGGCKVAMGNNKDHPLEHVEVGQTIMLTCEILGIEGLKTFSGEVRNVNQEAQRVSLGISFLDSDTYFLEKVETFVKSVREILG